MNTAQFNSYYEFCRAYNWCQAHFGECGGRWLLPWTINEIAFKNPEDYVLFMLQFERKTDDVSY